MESKEKKRYIMVNKKKLKGENIYIENDLGREEKAGESKWVSKGGEKREGCEKVLRG